MSMSNSVNAAPGVDYEVVEGLVDTVEGMKERLETVENELAEERTKRIQAQDRISELEDEVESRAAVRWDSANPQEVTVESTDSDAYPLDLGTKLDSKANYSVVEKQIEQIEELEDELDGRLGEEQQKRGQDDAKLTRRVNALADKAGVEITEADLMGEDKIRRVIKHGVEDVENKPNKAGRRAEVLLRNIGKWATKTEDKFGDRFVINGPTTSQRMEDKTGEKLATSQVNRVFEQIEEWGRDSPREVTTDFSGSPNRLVISLEVTNNV